jgi:hypothetical protein
MSTPAEAATMSTPATATAGESIRLNGGHGEGDDRQDDSEFTQHYWSAPLK